MIRKKLIALVTGREASLTSRLRRHPLIAILAILALTGTLAVVAGTHRATHGQAAVAEARPNVLVIESDDQTLESMRVMHNVNSLIGAQGATFKNSFVNYSLCCPSRSTFLTGQYEHNHGVLEQHGAERRLRALRGPARKQQPRRLAAGRGLLHRLDRQVPEPLLEQPAGPARLVGVVRGGPRRPGRRGHGRPGGLQLHAERERHLGPLRHRPGRLQAGRAHWKGRRLRQPSGAEGAAVLPLAHLHGAAHRRPGPEPEPALQLRRRGEAGAAPRPRIRLRAAAEASELQRGRRLRQAGRRSGTCRD